MNLPTIGIDREQARAKLQEFTAKKRRELTEMDRALMKGYKALSEGLTLIDINDAVKAGGFFADGLPKIALSRPDMKTCYFSRNWQYVDDENSVANGHFQAYREANDSDPVWKEFRARPEFSDPALRLSPFDEASRANLRVVLRHDVIPEPPDSVRRSRKEFWRAHQTLVPEVPVQFRPAGNEADYLVLWEVKEWRAVAPADPLLLERIAHPVYLVVAQWDLTPLEQKLLEAFRAGR